MNNSFMDTSFSLTEEDLIKFEKKFDIVIPDLIKKHYLKNNGGYPERTVFYDEENDCDYTVNYFYSIGCEDEGMSLEKIMPLLRDENIFPSWLVPLADDEGGDIFAYSIREEDNGAIYYYSHEFDYEEDPEEYITYLSEDIDSFLESLDYEDDEDDDE